VRKLMLLSCPGCLALTLLVLAPSAFAGSLNACKLNATANYTPSHGILSWAPLALCG
jgi:hypothetical protein